MHLHGHCKVLLENYNGIGCYIIYNLDTGLSRKAIILSSSIYAKELFTSIYLDTGKV